MSIDFTMHIPETDVIPQKCIPQRILYTGAKMPAMGLGTFNNDRNKNAYFWADNATIYVKGGNFGGVASNNKVVLSNGGQLIISGGTFNFDPTAWLANGYVATQNGSTWTVSAI